MQTIQPTQESVITSEMVAQFESQGYLVVENLFDIDHDLKPVVDDYAATLNALVVQLIFEGRLQRNYAELPFGRRLIQILQETIFP